MNTYKYCPTIVWDTVVFNLFEGNRRWPNAAAATIITMLEVAITSSGINEWKKKKNTHKHELLFRILWTTLTFAHGSYSFSLSLFLALTLKNMRKVVAILHRICRIAFKAAKATVAETAVNKIHGLMSTWEKNVCSTVISFFLSYVTLLAVFLFIQCQWRRQTMTMMMVMARLLLLLLALHGFAHIAFALLYILYVHRLHTEAYI